MKLIYFRRLVINPIGYIKFIFFKLSDYVLGKYTPFFVWLILHGKFLSRKEYIVNNIFRSLVKRDSIFINDGSKSNVTKNYEINKSNIEKLIKKNYSYSQAKSALSNYYLNNFDLNSFKSLATESRRIILEERQKFNRRKYPNYIFIDSAKLENNLGFVGHLDAYLKSRVLSGDTSKLAVVEKKYGTSYLAEHFLKNYANKYLEFIYEPHFGHEINLFQDDLGGPLELFHKTICWNHSFQSSVEVEWNRQTRPALYKLSKSDNEYFNSFLSTLGIKSDEKIVTLHIRNRNFKKAEAFRDADLLNYKDAINFLIDLGYIVIRVGSKHEPIFDFNNKNFIDLCKSPVNNFKLQLAATAKSEFFIGTSSGGYTLAVAFGVPVLLTNYLPLANLNLGPTSLFITKKFFDTDGKELKVGQIFSTPLTIARIPGQHELLNINVVENSPEEILKATMDMVIFIKNGFRPLPSQIKFADILRQFEILPGLNDYGVGCYVAPSFIDTYKEVT